jgi:hypothetical protein
MKLSRKLHGSRDLHACSRVSQPMGDIASRFRNSPIRYLLTLKFTSYIYVTPPSLSAIRGGSPVPFAVQNFDLFQFADSLQNINEPLLNPAGPSYVQNLAM